MAPRQPNLTKITNAFERAYNSAEKASQRKVVAQAKFFSAIDQVLEGKVRKQQLVDLEDSGYDGDDPVSFISRQYPGWRLVSVNDDGLQAVIEEDPKFMKFSFVNKENSRVYQRTNTQAGSSLDNERLREENPELWDQVTTWPEPWYTLIYEFAIATAATTQEELEAELDKYLKAQGMQRILKSPEEWSDDEFKAISKYIIPGSISTRIIKPRDATDKDIAL